MTWPQSCATVNFRAQILPLERSTSTSAMTATRVPLRCAYAMPRPLTLLPVWSRRGDARVCQLAFCAAALISAMSRGSLMWRSRNSIGSSLSAAATSSMNDSLAKWICGPTGSRRCEERSGEARSSSGGIVSQASRLLANA